jgi:O-antigen/teichoic acid export membrane protein
MTRAPGFCLQHLLDTNRKCRHIPAVNLWRSGIVISVVGFVGGLGNYAFQGIIGRQLEKSEFGYVNSTLGFIALLSLPLAIVSTSLVHYIAHFKATNDEARLRGLLSGSQKFLLRVTVGVSLAASLLLEPLSRFFNFPRTGLLLAALVCLLFGLWSGFAVALCQGMAWFKRMAIIGLIAVGLRLVLGWCLTRHFPMAEMAVYATAFPLLANLVLFFWWKDLGGSRQQISPWNREFLGFLGVTAACVGGTYCFTQGDLLVAQRYFSGPDLGNYSAAGLLGRALIFVVGPLLTVLFTSRSGAKSGASVLDQRILLALYAAGLAGGAMVLLVFRDFFVTMIFGESTPEASDMVVRFTLTMVFIGLIQAIGTFGLASRWFKLGLLYGGLGLAYWLTLLAWGRTPDQMLNCMPAAVTAALVILCSAWLTIIKKSARAPEGNNK